MFAANWITTKLFHSAQTPPAPTFFMILSPYDRTPTLRQRARYSFRLSTKRDEALDRADKITYRAQRFALEEKR